MDPPVTEFLTAAYPWTKTLHIVSMVAWMAGLFYLPRIYVYHAERANAGGEVAEVFKVMELKLFRLIMNPAMIATWVFGLVLLFTPGLIAWTADLWIWVKLALVGWLTWFHHWLGRRRKEFLADANTRTGRHYRMMNEVPTVALLVIVAMVVVKPF
jgi:putative membrane protein